VVELSDDSSDVVVLVASTSKVVPVGELDSSTDIANCGNVITSFLTVVLVLKGGGRCGVLQTLSDDEMEKGIGYHVPLARLDNALDNVPTGTQAATSSAGTHNTPFVMIPQSVTAVARDHLFHFGTHMFHLGIWIVAGKRNYAWSEKKGNDKTGNGSHFVLFLIVKSQSLIRGALFSDN
jgi:hypothetical protein